MSKVITIIAVIAIAVLSGCAGRTSINMDKQLNKSMKFPQSWFNTRVENSKERKGYIFGEGAFAVMKTDRDPYFAKAQADFRAQQSILRTLSSMVVAEISDYQSSYGEINQEGEDAAKQAAVAMSVLDLSGTEVIKREFIDGRLFSQARYPLSPANRSKILNAVKSGIFGSDAQRSKDAAEQKWGPMRELLLKRFDSEGSN